MSTVRVAAPEFSLAPGTRRQRVVAIFPYAAAAILTIVAVFSLFHLWGADLRVPITPPGGDYWFEGMVVQAIIESGWYFEMPRTGAPGLGHLYDFPMAEGLHALIIKVIGAVCRDFSLTINVFYILGYALISMSAMALFRALSLPTVPSIAAAVLFAFLPEHYIAAEHHLFLSAYYMVPLMVMVLIWLFSGEPLIATTNARRHRFRLTRKGYAATLIAVCTGSAGVYFAFFAAVFLCVVALYRACAAKRISAALPAVLVLVILSSTLTVNISPSLIYRAQNGRNSEVAARSPAEADIYALKLAQLILPIHNHRVPQLAAFKQRYLQINGSTGQNGDVAVLVSLGAVGAAGFLLLLAVAVLPPLAAWAPALRPLAVLNLSAFLLATLGGAGSVFAYGISPDIRCYYRVVIFIGLFSFAAVLVAVQRLFAELSSQRARNAAYAACGILIGAGLLDLTPAFPDTSAIVRTALENDESFIQSIERSVPPGSAIFQLPHHPFPEYGFNHRMNDYDHARGYLFSKTLRWSYGAVKGREDSLWQRSVAAKPIPEMLQTLRQSGFAGVYVDTFGYPDAARQLSSELEALVGKPLVSGDGRLLFFTFSGMRALSQREPSILEPWRRRDGRLPLRSLFTQS